MLVILTVSRQLHHDLIEVGLSSGELSLDAFLVLVSKHLGAVAAPLELLVVSLQTLDKFTVFLRTHAGQLNTHKHTHIKFDLHLTNIRNQKVSKWTLFKPLP